MTASGTDDDFWFLFNLFDVGWSVLKAPEGGLDVLVFLGVELVDACRFDIFVSEGNHWLLSFNLVVLGDQLLSASDLTESIILLELF